MSSEDEDDLSEIEAHKRRTIATAMKLKAATIVLAREDPSVFCRYVLRNEKDNKKIRQAPVHQKWHRLWSKHDRTIFLSHYEAGKTVQAIGRLLWELGRNPNLRICVVSNTAGMAKKITRSILRYIEKSDELHDVFPNLRPTHDDSLPWRADSMTVLRDGIGAKDPSIQSIGVHGNVLGSRVDLYLLDDILDHENTKTDELRKDVYDWIKSTLMTRLTDGGRLWAIGNAWHPQDAMHRIGKEADVFFERFPVVTPLGELSWPERWTLARIEKAKKDLGPLEALRQLFCQARDDASARFERAWVDGCIAAGSRITVLGSLRELELEIERATGRPAPKPDTGNPLVTWIPDRGFGIYHGVDLAIKEKESADKTAIATIAVDGYGTRRILRVKSGRWAGPRILDQLYEAYELFGGIFMVEDNGGQTYLIQFARNESALPIEPFTTTAAKKSDSEYGIEGLAVEMSNTKWLIPSYGDELDPEIFELCEQLYGYDPRSHTGDSLVALWLARQLAVRNDYRLQADYDRPVSAGKRRWMK